MRSSCCRRTRIITRSTRPGVSRMIFKRHRTADDVLFIDASREFEQGTTQNRLRKADREKILETYRARAFVDKYAYVAARDEIAENDYNFSSS